MLIDLEQQECERLLTLLANIKEAWVVTNPLIVKINKQMQEQQHPPLIHKGNNSDEREISARSKAR